MGHGQMINPPEKFSCRKPVQAADGGEVLVEGGLSDAEKLLALILCAGSNKGRGPL